MNTFLKIAPPPASAALRLLALASLVMTGAACSGDDGDSAATTDGGSDTQPGMSSTTADAETDAETSTTAGGGSTSPGTTPWPGACEDEPGPPCGEEWTKCKEDRDRDKVPFSCDNAPDITNPDQLDMDKDSFGDIADLCPTVQSQTNTLDSDRDGVGNDCDFCKERPSNVYNKDAVGIPAYMLVRNVPLQTDSDRDGIGDVCDNCVRVPNCQGYGDEDGQSPYVVGMTIDTEAADCQADADDDKIGDACAGAMAPGAAGPVGFANDDDFDQDGITNILDLCPRQPIESVACASDGDCPSGASCADAGVCNHADHDGDGVGDICDTCPGAANPMQLVDGGMQEDDEDEDFIGAACELNAACEQRPDPRAFGFYDISVNGYCCVTRYEGQDLRDPDGFAIDINELGPRPPGFVELPAGCEEALAASPDGKAHRMQACHVDELSELWEYFCLLPQWDQDFDMIGDVCDKCPYAYDPTNESYVDANDMVWEDLGAACHGEYDSEVWGLENDCMAPPQP